MKKLICLIIVGLFLVSSLIGASSEGLISRWSFEQNFNDSIGSNHGLGVAGPKGGDGISYSEFGSERVGFFGASFVGADTEGYQDLPFDEQWVFIPHNESLSNFEEITLGAWVSPISCAENLKQEYEVILNKGGEYRLALWNNKVYTMYNLGGTWGNQHGGSIVLNNSQWYYISSTYDGEKIRIYVNGVLDYEEENSEGLSNDSKFVSIGRAWVDETDEGESKESAGYYCGYIDEAGIWNRALSEEELKELYLAGLNCDELGTCFSINDPIWTDLSDNPITTADLGDTVKMTVVGQNLSTSSANYSIYENAEGRIWWNPITWFTGENLMDSIASSNYTFLKKGKYKFKVEIPEFEIINESSILEVSDEVNDSPFSLDLISPSCGSNFTIGTTIQIQINITDLDDLIDGELKINGLNVANLTNGLNEIEYLFDSSGEYSILVGATSRAKTLKEISNIMIVDSSSDERYTAACIDSPNNLASFTNYSVRFIAESTRAIDCTENPCQIIIPGGEGSEKIQFNWTFPNDEGMSQFISRGNLTDKNPSNFKANFKSAGFHKAILEVRFL
jgi:hypothetical protein